MALELSKTLASAVVANYWRIISVDYNIEGNMTTVRVGLYVSKTARDAEAQPVARFSFEWAGEDNPVDNEKLDTKSLLELCYTKIKTLQEFATAGDV
jgi:hypothetical protein